MTQEMETKYIYSNELNGFMALSLPYADSSMTMLLVMPENKTGLSNLISNMSNFDWTNIEKKMTMRSVNITMPRFNVSFESSIESTLKEVS